MSTLKSKNYKDYVWIALIGVISKPGSNLFGEALGAYVNYLALVNNEKEFVEKLNMSLKEKELELFSMEKPEIFVELIKKYQVEKYLIDLAKTVENTGNPMFGTFHSFKDIDNVE